MAAAIAIGGAAPATTSDVAAPPIDRTVALQELVDRAGRPAPDQVVDDPRLIRPGEAIVIDLAAIREMRPPIGPQVVDRLRLDAVDRLGLDDLGLLGGTLPDRTRLEGVEVPPVVEEAVARLDSPEWAVREAAADDLLRAGDIDEPIMAILQRGGLATEQRHRLLDVLCRRLASAARGALGIRMQFVNDGRPGVVVMDTLPGMPAEKVLRSNDRIMAIDGRPVFDSGRLQSIIMVERPGRRVSLELERPRRGPEGRELRDDANEPIVDRVTVELTLGSSDDLDRFEQGLPNMQGGARMRRGALRAGGANMMMAQGNVRVAALRQAQVEEAMVRFGPDAVNVAVANRSTPPPSDIDFTDIDRHPFIRSLMTYRALVAEGAVRITPGLTDSWTRTLIDLRNQARDPDLSEAMRDYLTAVADRYAVLMPR